MLRTLGRSAVLIGAISVLIQCWYPRVPLESEEEILQERMQAYDIVVIGAGLAGLSSVLQASLDGAHKLLLVDKEPKLGGNSAKASSGINALDDEMDKTFASDTTASAGELARPHLIDTLVNESGNAISFLNSFGLDLSKKCQLGGHSFARTHRNPTGPNVGFAITSALRKAVESSDSITVLSSAKAVELIRSNGRVSGVVLDHDGELMRVSAKAVILSTGGFGANKEMLKKSGGFDVFPTTNGPWAMGEGVGLGEAVGAVAVDMDQVQVHPTGFVDPANPTAGTKFLAPEALRGSGAILINEFGQRFVNELTTRDKVSAAVLEQPSRRAFLLLGEQGATKFGPTIGFYVSKNLMKNASSVSEISAAISGENTAALEESIYKELQTYFENVQSGTDRFHKKTFPTFLSHPDDKDFRMFVAQVVPVVHYTMGGLKINERAEVLDKSGQPIAGLFGAGELTGGVHGSNRLGGNSLLDCVVFGRIAARSALAAI